MNYSAVCTKFETHYLRVLKHSHDYDDALGWIPISKPSDPNADDPSTISIEWLILMARYTEVYDIRIDTLNNQYQFRYLRRLFDGKTDWETHELTNDTVDLVTSLLLTTSTPIDRVSISFI